MAQRISPPTLLAEAMNINTCAQQDYTLCLNFAGHYSLPAVNLSPFYKYRSTVRGCPATALRTLVHSTPMPRHLLPDLQLLRTKGGYGDDFGHGDGDPHHGGGEPAEWSASSPATGKGGARLREPWIANLHELIEEYVAAEVVDGEDLRFDSDALGSDYFPWATLTELLMCLWAMTTRPSRKSLQLLLDLLRYRDRKGRRINPKDVPKSAEHLISRARKRLPLLCLVRRNVKGKDGQPGQTVDARSTWFFSGCWSHRESWASS